MLNQTIFGLGTHCAAVKKGAVHKRRPKLGGGKGSKICQNCRRIVLKNCRHGGGEGGCQKSGKNCRRRLWMVAKAFF